MSPDLAAARAAMEDAEFARDRLKTLLPRLQQRLAKVFDQEAYDAWLTDRDSVKAKVDAAAERLANLYVPFPKRPAELLLEIEQVNAEVRRINNIKPFNAAAANGDGKSLREVELVARGIAGFGHGKSIMRDLCLPAWEADARPLWPPYRNVAVELALLTAQMRERAGDPRLTTGDWWRVRDDAERQRAEDAARLERGEAERRASMPVPAHCDWGEVWEREAADRGARAGP